MDLYVRLRETGLSGSGDARLLPARGFRQLSLALVAVLPIGPSLPEGKAYVWSLVQRHRQREDALNYTYELLHIRRPSTGARKYYRVRYYDPGVGRSLPYRELVHRRSCIGDWRRRQLHPTVQGC